MMSFREFLIQKAKTPTKSRQIDKIIADLKSKRDAKKQKKSQ